MNAQSPSHATPQSRMRFGYHGEVRSASYFLTGTWLISAAACASILGDDFTITTGDGGSPGTGGDVGSAGSTNAGGDATGGAGQGGGPNGGAGGGGSGQGGGTCDVSVAPPVQLDMVILADRTGSMGTNERWETLKTELETFFQTPGWARIAVAANLFEAPGGQSCQPQGYDPVQVALTDVPGDAATLNNHFNQFGPSGMTTIAPAVQGTLDWATTHFASVPGHRVVAVLIADGAMSSCGGGLSNMMTRAQAASTAGVPTYAISLDTFATNDLMQIATAGGTTVFSNIDAVGVRGTLYQIRDDALRCAHVNETGVSMPSALDASLIINGTPTPLPPVAGETACSGHGWYFPPSNTDRILLCPTSCQQVTSAPSTALELRYNCD